MSTHQGPAVIDDGVRMGVLYDLAQDAVSRDYALNFRLVWKDIIGVCVMHGHCPKPPPLPTTVEAAGISKETEVDPEPELKEPGLKIEHLVSGITAYTKLEGHFRSQGIPPSRYSGRKRARSLKIRSRKTRCIPQAYVEVSFLIQKRPSVRHDDEPSGSSVLIMSILMFIVYYF